MESALTPFITFAALLALALAYVAIWSGRKVLVRSISLLLSIAFIPLFWFAINSLLGHPESVTEKELRAESKCTIVLYAEIKEKVGIFALVRLHQVPEPRYVFIPWNLKLAVSLQNTLRELKREKKGKIMLGGKECQRESTRTPKRPPPLDDGMEQDFMFYPDPVEEDPPPKDLSPFYTREQPLQMPSR